MNILEEISKKLTMLDNKNDSDKNFIDYDDFRKTYEEGYCDGVDNVISEIRAILRKG